MKSTFEILFELFNDFINNCPNSQFVLLVGSLFVYFLDIICYKSAAYAILDVKKTNREKRALKQKLDSIPRIKAKFMIGYVKMTTVRKGIMKFIVTENFIFRFLTALIWIFLILSVIFINIISVGWYIFVLKLIICDLVGFIFSFIFGGIAWEWKFRE